jgi:hypothetical protein
MDLQLSAASEKSADHKKNWDFQATQEMHLSFKSENIAGWP